jgi:signal transduction histidine kinase
VHMRPTLVLGALGAVALVVGLVTAVATGRAATAGWMLIGPGPYYAAGLVVALRRPDRPAGLWCLLTGTAFLVSVCLGDVLLPLTGGWPVALARQWAEYAAVVATIGLLGWFPGGRPRHATERRVVRAAAGTAVVLPILYALTHPLMAPGVYPNPEAPRVPSPVHLPALEAAAPVVGLLHASTLGWPLIGLGLLALRHRRIPPDERRRVRLLLLGMSVAIVLFAALVVTGSVVDDPTERLLTVLLWPLVLATTLGTMVIALVHDGAFQAPLRRSLLYRVLWALIAAAYVAAAAALGVLAAGYLSAGAAILLAAAAALLFQPLQRRLEQIADRWVFGARLDGYRVLARFGRALESAPRSADLLAEMAEAVRDGLGLTWVRVRLDLTDAGQGCAGTEPGEPALVVPLADAGAPLGRIECGPRRDGPLLDDDRRLLQHLAGQAATAVRNLHLTAELSSRLTVIREQAADLAASRARIVTAQDAERRRIQRDLHDGVQQEIVVVAAKLAMARQRLRRGDPGPDTLLAEVQHDVTGLLNQVREFAHAIHPPVLADQGLLEAIEARAARLPLGVIIEADAGLRGVHYPQNIETTAWYVLSEALTNVVKHAGARQVRVRLGRPGGRLTLEVRDDGAGFDPSRTGRHGLAGLADRVATVDGTLLVESVPGCGTTLRAEIPIPAVPDA